MAASVAHVDAQLCLPELPFEVTDGPDAVVVTIEVSPEKVKSINLQLRGNDLVLDDASRAGAFAQTRVTLPAHTFDSTPSAKYKKKRGALVVTVAKATATSLARFILPHLPPPGEGLGAHQNNRRLFDLAKRTLTPGDVEDLTTAVMEWGADRSDDGGIRRLAGLFARAPTAEDANALASCFGAFVRDLSARNLFEEAFNEARMAKFADSGVVSCSPLSQGPPTRPQWHGTAFGGSDDAASRVLDHIVNTGKMPDDEDPDAAPQTCAMRSQSTCARNKPLVIVQDEFLPLEAFETLRRDILAHPKMQSSDSEGLGDCFEGTRGFIVRFNKLAIASGELAQHSDTQILLPYFEAARDPECNAFVLNCLVCSPAPATARATRTGAPAAGTAATAVDWHRDATLALVPWAEQAGVKPQLAHQVDVLYIQVPPMVGGHLLLRDPRRPAWRVETEASRSGAASNPVDATVAPMENRKVSFRGDAEHCVTSFHAKGPGEADTTNSLMIERVSLVLEQYKVPVGSFDFTVQYELVDPRVYSKERFRRK